MNLSEWQDLLRRRNAKNRLAGGATIIAQQAAKASEISQALTTAGGNPSLWDYAAGTSLGSSLTGNVATSAMTLPRDVIGQPLVIRLTTTVGATPSATFTVQGSHDNSNWFTLSAADSATPDTFAANFVLTTATTVQKLVQPNQKTRYIRVNITANTNVTVTTIDAILL